MEFEEVLKNQFLIELALLLFAATIGGKIASLVKMPEVLGQILTGIIIGPTIFNLVNGEDEIIHVISEIGVIFLMFLAGLETDLKELKSSGKGASMVALGGVVFPLALGTLVPFFLFRGYLVGADVSHQFLGALYVGTILTATSVSISVSVLRDMGSLGSRQGISILGAAIIDDVLGIIMLAVVTGMINPGSGMSIGGLIIRIVIFFVLSIVVGIVLSKLITKYATNYAWKDQFITVAIVLCFMFAFTSEVFKVASITGAYVAGVIVAATPFKHKVVRRIQYVAYSLFTPIFFVSIGLKAHISSDILRYIGYSLVIVVIAILGKIVGCGLGAKLSGFTSKQSMQIGVGMIARAEVALIVATQGLNRGIIGNETFTSVVLLVVVSTIVTPPLLKYLFSKEPRVDQTS